MSSSLRTSTTTLALGCLAALLVGPGIFLGVGLFSGMGLGGVIQAALEQATARRVNLLLPGALGVAPLLLFGAPILLAVRLGKVQRGTVLLAAAIVPALAVQAWAHFTYWSSYLPERTFLSWPHGLELVIGPLIFAPVASVICLVATAVGLRASSRD